MSNMNFAISGLGSISPRHLEAIKHVGGKTIGVYDPDWSKEYFYKDSQFYQSFEDLLETTAEWAVILSPNKYHYSQATRFLEKGKKVIVEKPAAMSLYDIDQYRGKEIYTISQLRYLEDVVKLKQQTPTDHEVNIKIMAHRHPITLANWRHNISWSGGLMYFVGIHYIDLVTYLFGNVKNINYVSWQGTWKCQFGLDLEHAKVNASFEVTETKPNAKTMAVDGRDIDLAEQFYSLHNKAYENIMNGHGIHPASIMHVYETIHKINSYNHGFGYY